MAESGTAPGRGEVPEELVREKIHEILVHIFETVVKPRQRKAAEAEARKLEILSHVVKVDTEEQTITDEGGRTKLYIHKVLMPSGKTYIFRDRNVFDFGRVINYNRALISKVDGKIGLNRWVDGGGWVFEAVDEDSELIKAYHAAELYGFAKSVIRI